MLFKCGAARAHPCFLDRRRRRNIHSPLPFVGLCVCSRAQVCALNVSNWINVGVQKHVCTCVCDARTILLERLATVSEGLETHEHLDVVAAHICAQRWVSETFFHSVSFNKAHEAGVASLERVNYPLT